MKGLTIILALGLASSDKLDRTYLPPQGAKLSDGNLGAADVPLDLPRETPPTTIRPQPKIPVRPDDTHLIVGNNRGQPSTTGAPQGLSPTTGPFFPKYIPSSTPFYTQTTTPEGFGTTLNPIDPTGLPSERPNLYDEKQVQKLRPIFGEIIGVKPTPGSVKVCEEGDTRCELAQEVRPIYRPNDQIIGQQETVTPAIVQGLRPVYGKNGKIIGVTSTPEIVAVSPTAESVQGFRPVYGKNGEIISVTAFPGTVVACKDGDVNCQKLAQQNIPVYDSNGQLSRKEQGFFPTYGQSGEIVGITPAPGTMKACKENDVNCQKTAKIDPIYGPSGQIIGYQHSTQPKPGSWQGSSTQEQQINPVYGTNSQIISYDPSITPKLKTTQSIQSVYDPRGHIINQKLTPGTVQVCNEGDVQCKKQGQHNVPIYGPNRQFVGNQPIATPIPEIKPNFRPIYGLNREITGVTPTEGTEIEQKIVPVYGNDGKIIGYKPNVTPGTGLVQEFHSIYGPSGQIIGQKLTPSNIQVCKASDVECQEQIQQNITVLGPSEQSVGYQPSLITPSPGTSQDPKSQGQQIVPIYDTSGQVIGYQPSVTTTPGLFQGVQPVHSTNGQIIGQKPTPRPKVQFVSYQTNVTPKPGPDQDFSSIYGQNGQIISSPRSMEGEKIVPVYDNSGQIVGYKPSVVPTTGVVQELRPFHDLHSQVISQQPTPTSVQVCKEGAQKCQKQVQQNFPVDYPYGQINGYQPSIPYTEIYTPDSHGQQITPVYGPSGQVIGYQPSVTPTPSGQILSQQPIPAAVQICTESDLQCQKKALQNIPVYGPSGQIIGYQPSVTPTPETAQGIGSQGHQIIPVYDPSGKIVGYQSNVIPTPGTVQGLQLAYGPSGEILSQQPTPATVQVCKEGDVQCQKKALQNIPVYGPNGLIVGYQPRITPGVVQELQPVYNSNDKIISQRPSGLVQGCKEDDVQCQDQAKQFVPIYSPNGQVIGQKLDVTPTSGMVQGLQPVYQQQIIKPTPETVQICRKDDIQCQKKVQQVRPVNGPNEQIIGPKPTIVLSPTTRKPIYEGTKNIYQPASTAKPYFKPSVISTTSAPLNKYGTTPTGIVTTPAIPNLERPLSESDKKAVNINYDFVLTPDGYSYNFDTSNGIHVDETGIVKDGNKAIGTYSYIGDDGKKYEVTYKADENGFQPTGDHLPTPHPIPVDIQRVIEQAAKDKQAGIYDDGSYNKNKYGYERYDQLNRIEYGDQQHSMTTGRKPFTPSNDENLKQEEGYHYTPPLQFPERGQKKRPQENHEERPKTQSVDHGHEYSYEQGAPKYRPSGGLESDITTYRPTGTTQHGQVNKYKSPVPSRPDQVIDTTTYRPSVIPQGQVDKFERPNTSHPGQEPVGAVEPLQVDKYERPISTRPGQRYSTSTYIPIGTTEISKVEQFGRPFYSQTGEEPSETAESDAVDKYGRPITSKAGQGIGSTTYRPIVTSAPTQVDKFKRPIYPQSREEAGQVNENRKLIPSRPGQGIGSTTYRPTENGQLRQEDKFGTPIYSQVGEEPSETSGTVQEDDYGRPVTTYGPTISGQPAQKDQFGRPIYSQPEEELSGIAESGQVDKYGIPIPSRPGQVISTTTYKSTVKGQPMQMHTFGRPTYSQTEEEISGTTKPGQTDEYSRQKPSRSGQDIGSTTYRPNLKGQLTEVDKFERPIYSQPGIKHFETAEPGQIDEYGRPVSSRSRQGTTYRPTLKIQPMQVDNFLKPIYSKPGEEQFGTAEPSQGDKYGRPILSRPGQGYSPTTSRPSETNRSGLLDVFGRPISPAPESAQPGQVDKYGRPIPVKSGQGISSTTYRPVSSTQAPGYQPGSDVFEQKPEEFGPHEKQGPKYLTPYENKTAKLVGEDFRGPKQPPRFDPKTGYHY